MPELTYYLFNLLVFMPVLLLSIFTDVQPHKDWRTLLRCVLFVSLPFMYWDIWAANEGHWGFNPEYVTTFRFLNVPVEEFLFFITVPFACLYVWGVIKKHYRAKKQISTSLLTVILSLGLLASFLLLTANWGNGYTRSAGAAFLLTIALLWRQKTLVCSRQFWMFQVVLLGLFVLANSALTALPVITYGEASYIGFRIGTIPLEDFFFNFALINLWLLVWESRRASSAQVLRRAS
jgi:lycopene cyclase domain-containing protein